MHRLALVFSLALTLTLALTLAHKLTVPASFFVRDAVACGEDSSVDSPNWGIFPEGGAPETGTCPEPDCDLVTDVPYGYSPFVRGSIGGTAPGVGCFAVAKKNAASHQIFLDNGNTFDRAWSADGVNNWSVPRPVSGLTSEPWAGPGVQCPDPHYNPDGSLYMYYNVKMPVGGGTAWGVARATSTNGGRKWSMASQPVVTPTTTHYPYMPSVAEYNGKLLLTYAWVCNTSLTVYADIHVLESTDGGNSWTTLTTQAITPGGCDDWDNASVNRPRLVIPPTGNAIYMFFSGFPWDPDAYGTGGPTRDPASIGVAKSCDGGQTWTKAQYPVFEQHGDPLEWDTISVVKPSLVWVDNSTLRLYYEGAGPGGGGLGYADASWPLPAMFNPPCVIDPGGLHGLSTEFVTREEFEGLATIASAPNPTSGTTRIGIQLRQSEHLGNIEVGLFDVGGRSVSTLWSGPAAGLPSDVVWDGRLGNGAEAPAGRYLVQVTSAGVALGTHWITRLR